MFKNLFSYFLGFLNLINANFSISHTGPPLGHASHSELPALTDIMEMKILPLNSVRISDLFSV